MRASSSPSPGVSARSPFPAHRLGFEAHFRCFAFLFPVGARERWRLARRALERPAVALAPQRAKGRLPPRETRPSNKCRSMDWWVAVPGGQLAAGGWGEGWSRVDLRWSRPGPVCAALRGLRSVSIPPRVAAACTHPLGAASCPTRTGAGSGARILCFHPSYLVLRDAKRVPPRSTWWSFLDLSFVS